MRGSDCMRVGAEARQGSEDTRAGGRVLTKVAEGREGGRANGETKLYSGSCFPLSAKQRQELEWNQPEVRQEQ